LNWVIVDWKWNFRILIWYLGQEEARFWAEMVVVMAVSFKKMRKVRSA
jgi:hypothetical protein